MLPANVKFTDLEINTEKLVDVVSRCIDLPVPISWKKITVNNIDNNFENEILSWIQETLEGRWAYYMLFEHILPKDKKKFRGRSTNLKLVLFFESVNDAILFKMLSGHNAGKI